MKIVERFGEGKLAITTGEGADEPERFQVLEFPNCDCPSVGVVGEISQRALGDEVFIDGETLETFSIVSAALNCTREVALRVVGARTTKD